MEDPTRPLRIVADYAQDRLLAPPQRVLAQGSYEGYSGRRVPGWERRLSSGVWQDPVTYTLFLEPAPENSAWLTSFTGIYARLQAADFTLTTSSKWRQETHSGSGDYWLVADGLTADESGLSTASWPQDTPFWVGYFQYASEASRFVQFECGWNSSASLTGGVGLRVYSTGEAEVWKGGQTVGTYKVSGGQGGSSTPQQQFGGLYLIPCRRRELLVVSRAGDGFTHAFDDVADDGSEAIVPAGKFWFKVPVATGNRSAKLQIARLQFASSGYAVSTPLSFADAPESGTAQSVIEYADLYGGTATVSLKQSDGTTAFTADGSTRDCRVRVDLTGSGTATPGVYGAMVAYDGPGGTTSDTPVELQDYVVACSLSVGESASSVRATVELGRHPELPDLDRPKSTTNRPLLLRFGEDGGPGFLLAGRTMPPAFDGTISEDEETVVIPVRDRWKALEGFIFPQAFPLDGQTLADALRLVVGQIQTSDDFQIDAEADAYTIPASGSQTAGEWAFLVEVGQTAAEVVERLMQDYAADWLYGYEPTADGTKFVAKAPGSLTTVPDVTLYATADQALGAIESEYGFSEDQARRNIGLRVYHEYREEAVEPEATDVRVTGWDPRTQKPIQVYKVDTVAEDPTLEPVDRPDNWLGEKRVYGWADPAIQSEEVATRCCEALYRRLTPRRVLTEWSCGFLFKPDGSPVWRGDVVALDGRGTFRVTSVEASFEKEPDPEDADGYGSWVWRPARYTGERIDEETGDTRAFRGRAPVSGLDSIAAYSRARPMSALSSPLSQRLVPALTRSPVYRTLLSP